MINCLEHDLNTFNTRAGAGRAASLRQLPAGRHTVCAVPLVLCVRYLLAPTKLKL